MTSMECIHCGSTIAVEEGQQLRFCPFCGKPLTAEQGPSDLEKRIHAEKKPKKKYAIIQEALRVNPDDLEANRALLFHGRLHEPMTRGSGIDFSIIKCYLLHIFDDPSAYSDAVLDAKYDELLRDAQLQRTMTLSGDPETFFADYIGRLAFEYIDLFLRGDSKYASVAFGFARSMDSIARRVAPVVRHMLDEIAISARLTGEERALLLTAVREGYGRVFPGQQKNLDTEA